MNHRRWLVVSLIAVLLGGGTAVWFLRDRSEPPPTQEVGTPANGASATTPSGTLASQAPDALREERSARSWRPGLQCIYSLTAEQRVTFEQQDPGASGSTLRLAIQGGLTVTVVGVQADKVELQFQLRPSGFSFEADGRDALDAKSRPEMFAHLQMPFYATLNRQGAALFTHFEPQVDPVTQNLLRSLVSSTQFVTPNEPRSTWQAQEMDSLGLYAAAYNQGDKASVYTKTKERYLRMSSPSGLRPMDARTRITPDATASISLGADGWPESLVSREKVVVDSGQGLPKVMGEGQVRIDRTQTRHEPVLIGALSARRQQLITTSLATQSYAAGDSQAELKRVLGGASLADLLGELRTLPKDDTARGLATSRVLNRMRALFTLEPEQALRVPALLREEKDRNTYSTLIGALSAASTPEAVRALGQSVGDAQLPDPVRVDAAAGLGMASKPTQEGISSLRELARSGREDLHSTASLALGNTARNLNTQEDSRGAEALVNELTGAVASAPTPEERALQLRALANTADARALPTIQEALRHPSVLVRAAAVEALRLIPGATADQLIATSMVEDPLPEVRRAAVFASSFRPLVPLLPAIERTLRTDPADEVRIEVVRLIGSQRTQLPGAMQLLQWAGQNDPNEDVRHTALAFLAPPPADPKTP